MRRGLVITIVVPLALALGAAHNVAHAQAWVGPKGSLDLTLDYNLGTSDKVIGEGSLEFPNAGVQTHQFTLDANYVILPKLAVDVSLPFIAIKYTGGKGLYPHPGGGKYDDGAFHTTLTDLQGRVRYQVLDGFVALAPHIGFTIPVADYETVGNAVAGRHLKALHVGASVGKIFADTFYAHFVYDFALSEKYDRTQNTGTYGQNTSDLAFTIGDKLLDGKLDINLDANYHLTHGGVSFNDFASLPSDVQLYHDAVLKESMFLLGGGIGYMVTDTIDVAFAARLFISGANTQNASVYGLAITWSPL